MECYVRKHDKLVRYLDMCIEEASREYARVTMPITENHKNAAELLAQPDVDGGLIGGASLKPDQFVDIINAANQE